MNKIPLEITIINKLPLKKKKTKDPIEKGDSSHKNTSQLVIFGIALQKLLSSFDHEMFPIFQIE